MFEGDDAGTSGQDQIEDWLRSSFDLYTRSRTPFRRAMAAYLEGKGRKNGGAIVGGAIGESDGGAIRAT
eukprot:scaffold395479_cov31-Attheya_sp.AAC.1